jgi:hypothetical protein
MSLYDDLSKLEKDLLKLGEAEEIVATAPKVEKPILQQALYNLPSSTLQLGKDIIQPIIAPGEFFKSTYSLGKGVIELAIPGEQPDEKTAKAVGEYLANRYGGMSNIRDTFAKDPAGILADAAMLLRGGGALATKVPGLTKAGQIVSQVGKKIDPVEYLYQGGKLGAQGAGKATTALLGLTTGVGGEAISQAVQAGKAGGDTQRLLTGEMRGTSEGVDVVSQATGKLKEMALERGKEYQTTKAGLRLDELPVDIGKVRQSFNEFSDSKKFEGMSELSAKAQKKLANISKIIDEFEANPKLHNAKGLDMLKRRVDAEYPSGLNVGDSGLVVSQIRNKIKQQILTEAPEYGKVMKAYEQAIALEKTIMKELSLGNKTAAGTALRKLQSSMRNNVNTNYGNRLDMLKNLDPDLLPQLAGQALSNISPRGLQGLSAGSAAAYGIPAALSGLINPAALLGLPLQSPRLMGEVALKAGQAQRIAEKVPTGDILRTARPISSATRDIAAQPSQEELERLKYLNSLLR